VKEQETYFGCRIGWHSWSKWKRYVWKGKIPPALVNMGATIPNEEWYDITQDKEDRQCLRCGTSRDRKVK